MLNVKCEEILPAYIINDQEAYTPLPIINILRNYSGSIDVDVADTFLCSLYIKPALYYSKYLSGLSDDAFWFGNILCNPPYSDVDKAKIIPLWIQRIHSELAANHLIDNIFLILYSRNTTKWSNILQEDSKRLSNDATYIKLLIFKNSNVTRMVIRIVTLGHSTCTIILQNIYLIKISIAKMEKVVLRELNTKTYKPVIFP